METDTGSKMARSPPAPSPRPPPGHVLPSFLKGGLGISVGVVGPVAAPSPARRAPSPLPSLRAAAATAAFLHSATRRPLLSARPARPRTPPRPAPTVSPARGAHVRGARRRGRPAAAPARPRRTCAVSGPRKQQRPPRPLVARERRARGAAGLAPRAGSGGPGAGNGPPRLPARLPAHLSRGA